MRIHKALFHRVKVGMRFAANTTGVFLGPFFSATTKSTSVCGNEYLHHLLNTRAFLFGKTGGTGHTAN